MRRTVASDSPLGMEKDSKSETNPYLYSRFSSFCSASDSSSAAAAWDDDDDGFCGPVCTATTERRPRRRMCARRGEP
uniref:Uncharacterized protein n=1 Tax=Arundo donax TaxID=35708 RepID=A0A0A9ENG7_ARUDO